uniref:Uncharacterized protein n=1 Tax=Romanomermis culicivorax TaxID=13658 RepID=A0A915JLR7_ROMCU
MVANISLPNCAMIAISGGDLVLIEKVVNILLNLPTISVILHLCIDNVSTFKATYKANKKDAVVDCTKLNMNAYEQNLCVQQFLISMGNKNIVQLVSDSFLGIGRWWNMSGQIWGLIREGDFLQYLLVRDSMVTNISIPNCPTIAVSGTNLVLIKKILDIVLNLPMIRVIVHVGINSLSTFEATYKANRKNGIADCTKLNMNALGSELVHFAGAMLCKHGKGVIISAPLPRTGSIQLENKVAKIGRVIVRG